MSVKVEVTKLKGNSGRIMAYRATIGAFEGEGPTREAAEQALEAILQNHKDYGWTEVVKFARDEDGPVCFVLTHTGYGWHYTINRPGSRSASSCGLGVAYRTQRQAEECVDAHIRDSFQPL